MGIEDIARQLGVSKTTVSRAISGTGRISPATRKRVLELVKETGFIPNASASSLATTCTHNIAYAMPLSEDSIRFSFFLECMFGVHQVVSEHGYNLITVDSSPQELTKMAASRRVDGIVMASFDGTDEELAALARYKVPMLLIGSTKVEGITQVQYDFRPGFRELTTRLHEMWQCPIALLLSDHHYRANISRAECFREAAMALGIQEPAIYSDLMTAQEISAAMSDLPAKGIRGIICGDEAICQNTLYTMLQCIRCPQQKTASMWKEFHIAAFHTSPTDRDFFPEIPTLIGDTVVLGQRAATVILNIINGNPCEQITNLNPQLVLGEQA